MSISAVRVSEFGKYKRIDAEYYQPHLLNAERQLDEIGWKVSPLGELVKEGYRVVYENTFISEEPFDPMVHAKFLQAADISSGFPVINYDSIGWVGIDDWIRYPKGRIQRGEILVEVKGKAEKVALVPDDFPEDSLVTGTLYKMLVDKDKVTPEYVLVYFLSKFGRNFRDRVKTNTLISYVSKEELYDIPVPIAPRLIQDAITAKYQQAYRQYKQSEQLYAEAEHLLSAELGLDRLDLSESLFNVRRVSEVQQSKRADAEYYKRKYQNLLNYFDQKPSQTLEQIATFAGGATPLGADYLEEGVPFLRIQNVGDNKLVLDDVAYIHKDIHESELKRSQLAPGDVLITITGRIGTSAVVTDELKEANINQHIVRMRLKSKDINPFYLAAFLNSVGGRLQTEREAYGTTRDALPYYCLAKIRVLTADKELQNQVEQTVRKAAETEKDAKRLLAEAKGAVERLIENA